MAEQDQHPPITLALSPETINHAQITDGTHAIDVTKQGDALYLQISTHNEARVSLTLLSDGRMHLVFDPTLHAAGIEPASFLPSPQPTAQEAPTAPEQEPTTITGNIGRTPIFRPHTESGLIYSFPLGVHPEKGITHWYDVLTTEELATHVKETYEKGQKVVVTGTDHTHTETKKDGTEKLVRHFYATAITKPHAKQHS